MVTIQNGRVVLKDKVLEKAAVTMENGVIVHVSKDAQPALENKTLIDVQNAFIVPGFVDIHCHAGGEYWAHENPEQAALHHLNSGTTSIVLTLYHDIGHEGLIQGAKRIKEAMDQERPGNIAGLHLEGPYLSKEYGASAKTARIPDPDEYNAYIREFGTLIRQWTFTPEVQGTDAFIEAAAAAGIVLAIGHSAASPERVYEVVDKGVTHCTHLCNATGCSVAPSRYAGTQEVSFDQAVMLNDKVTCEVINDSMGVHVRPLMTKLIAKTIGIDRLVGITDACVGSSGGDDVNIVDGEIYGSTLNMLRVAKNFMKNTGLSIVEVFRVCALNPAKVAGLTDRGEIAVGKRADVLLLDDNLEIREIYLKGVKQ